MNLLDREILLVDKPAGMSSFAVVARVRRILTEQTRENLGQSAPKRAKVGHAGTLDPFATGLLICLLGKGTKKAGEFLKLDKRYEATICLGKVSTTGDIEGEISEYRRETEEGCRNNSIDGAEKRCRNNSTDRTEGELDVSGELETADAPTLEALIVPTLEQVEETVEKFRGEIWQKVPAYSAVKIDGRRAYDLARKGIEVEMPERKVKVYEIKVVSYEWPMLKIKCFVSSGTYIRALGEDIGKALGVGGYLTELRRTQIGEYNIEDAVTLEEMGVVN